MGGTSGIHRALDRSTANIPATSHHGQIGEEGDDLSILSETQSVLNDLLRLVEDVDEPHFSAMKRLVSSAESTAQ